LSKEKDIAQMPIFISSHASLEAERMSDLLTQVFEKIMSSPVFARGCEDEFELSDVCFDAACMKIEMITSDTSTGVSLVSIRNPVGTAPQIYVVTDGRAVLDEILTDAAANCSEKPLSV
jgi:hypothetical protein